MIKIRLCKRYSLFSIRLLLSYFVLFNIFAQVVNTDTITVTSEVDSDSFNCDSILSSTCNLRGAMALADLVRPVTTEIVFSTNVSLIKMNLNDYGSLKISAGASIKIYGPTDRKVEIQPLNRSIENIVSLFVAPEAGTTNFTLFDVTI